MCLYVSRNPTAPPNPATTTLIIYSKYVGFASGIDVIVCAIGGRASYPTSSLISFWPHFFGPLWRIYILVSHWPSFSYLYGSDRHIQSFINQRILFKSLIPIHNFNPPNVWRRACSLTLSWTDHSEIKLVIIKHQIMILSLLNQAKALIPTVKSPY